MLESFSESGGTLPKAAASSSAKLVIVYTQLLLVNFIQFSISFKKRKKTSVFQIFSSHFSISRPLVDFQKLKRQH